MAYGVIRNEKRTFTSTNNGMPGATYEWVVDYRSRSGTRTANYRQKVAKGQRLPENNYSCTGHSHSVSPGEYRVTRWTGSEWKLERVVTYPGQSGYSKTAVAFEYGLQANALRDCQNKIADGSANFAQMFAERKQVYSLVLDTAKRLANLRRTLADYAMKRVKHEALVKVVEKQLSTSRRKVKLHDILDYNRKYRKFSWYRPEFDRRKLSGNLASDWLAIQYGVRPLLQDVTDAAEHYAQRALDAEADPTKPRVMRFRGKANRLYSQREGVSNGLFVEYKFSTRCTMTFQVNVDYLRQAQQTGILNLAALGYELLPYSFVVDWFADVGDYLKRIGYTAGLTFVDGFYSEKAEANYNGIWTNLPGTAIAPIRTSGVAWQVRRSRFTTPPAAVRPSLNGGGLTLVRSLNAIALMQVNAPPSSEGEWRNSSVRKLR